MTSDLPAFQANPGLYLVKGPDPSVRMLAINPRPQAPAGKYLSNTLVRQAIAYAIDYERIAKFRDGERVYSIYHKGQTIPDVAIEPQKDLQYNPAKAKELLTQAGYPNGIPEPIELIADSSTYGVEEIDMASIIKNNLDAVGIRVNVRVTDPVLRTSILNGRNHTLTLFSAASTTSDPDYAAQTNYYSPRGVQRWGFNRSDVDQLVLQGLAELDDAKRVEIYHKLQIMCDGPDLLRGAIYLYIPWNYVVAWKYVKGDLTPTILFGYSLDWTKADIDPERKIS